MKTDIKQYSPEWHADRVGRITASVWEQLNAAPSTAKYKTAFNNLVFERLTGQPANADQPKTFFMQRGTEMEEAAFKRFELETWQAVERELWYTDGKLVGASPDGLLVGTNFGLELKYPKESTQIEYLREPAALVEAYSNQINFQMYVCGFDGVWLVSDNKHTKQLRIFVERQEVEMLKIASKIEKINAQIAEICLQLSK